MRVSGVVSKCTQFGKKDNLNAKCTCDGNGKWVGPGCACSNKKICSSSDGQTNLWNSDYVRPSRNLPATYETSITTSTDVCPYGYQAIANFKCKCSTTGKWTGTKCWCKKKPKKPTCSILLDFTDSDLTSTLFFTPTSQRLPFNPGQWSSGKVTGCSGFESGNIKLLNNANAGCLCGRDGRWIKRPKHCGCRKQKKKEVCKTNSVRVQKGTERKRGKCTRSPDTYRSNRCGQYCVSLQGRNLGFNQFCGCCSPNYRADRIPGSTKCEWKDIPKYVWENTRKCQEKWVDI